jgi:hypothetical protein
MPKRKGPRKGLHVGVGMSHWAEERRSYAAGSCEYVYVCNLHNNDRDWPRCGNTFKRVEVIGSRYNNSNKLPVGFAEGDIFVEFGTGKALTIARRKTSLRRYVIRKLTNASTRYAPHRVTQSFRLVERELRWRRNSYVMKRYE